MREKAETVCAIICAVLLSIILILLVSCIPVTIRPEFDDAGLPKAIPVAPVGSQDAAGVRKLVQQVRKKHAPGA